MRDSIFQRRRDRVQKLLFVYWMTGGGPAISREHVHINIVSVFWYCLGYAAVVKRTRGIPLEVYTASDHLGANQIEYTAVPARVTRYTHSIKTNCPCIIINLIDFAFTECPFFT